MASKALDELSSAMADAEDERRDQRRAEEEGATDGT